MEIASDRELDLLRKIEALTTRLRSHAISLCYHAATGELKYAHCDECDTRWMSGEDERHKPDCILGSNPIK